MHLDGFQTLPVLLRRCVTILRFVLTVKTEIFFTCMHYSEAESHIGSFVGFATLDVFYDLNFLCIVQ